MPRWTTRRSPPCAVASTPASVTTACRVSVSPSSCRNDARAVFHIVVFEPEIPPNTGNLIRLVVNTGCELHLIKPLGFSLDRKSVRRAGRDFEELATVHVHENFFAARSALPGNWFAIETGASRRHVDVSYGPGDVLLFGSERRGLPAPVLAEIDPHYVVTLPMRAGNR